MGYWYWSENKKVTVADIPPKHSHGILFALHKLGNAVRGSVGEGLSAHFALVHAIVASEVDDFVKAWSKAINQAVNGASPYKADVVRRRDMPRMPADSAHRNSSV